MLSLTRTETQAPMHIPPIKVCSKLSTNSFVGRIVGVLDLHEEFREIVSMFTLEPTDIMMKI